MSALNKDTGSNDDDWLEYPIILFDAVLQSPHSSFSKGLQEKTHYIAKNGFIFGTGYF